MKSKEKIEDKLLELLNEISNKLLSSDAAEIQEYIEHREWGLAFETLCILLEEDEIRISIEFYNKLSQCGKLMNIAPSYLLSIKKLII